MIWNGFIQFFQDECLVFCVIALIQVFELRLKPDFNSIEKYCSILGLVILIAISVLPLVLLVLYIMKIRSSKPLPDLDDHMTVEEIKYVYGNLKLEEIQRNSYTVSKHAKFMRNYGILIEGIDLNRLGKAWTISIGFLSIARQVVLSIGIFYFRK